MGWNTSLNVIYRYPPSCSRFPRNFGYIPPRFRFFPPSFGTNSVKLSINSAKPGFQIPEKTKKPHPWKGTRFIVRGTTLVNTICKKTLCSLHSDNGICRCIFTFLPKTQKMVPMPTLEVNFSHYSIKVLSVTALSP